MIKEKIKKESVMGATGQSNLFDPTQMIVHLANPWWLIFVLIWYFFVSSFVDQLSESWCKRVWCYKKNGKQIMV